MLRDHDIMLQLNVGRMLPQNRLKWHTETKMRHHRVCKNRQRNFEKQSSIKYNTYFIKFGKILLRGFHQH